MGINHKNHLIHQNIVDKQEMKIFYLSVFLMYLAEGMIAVFVPVYLYHLNYPIWQIVIFYTLVSLSFVTLSLVGARLVSKIGIKYSILLSTFFLTAYYLLLNYIDQLAILFFVLPVLMSLKMIFLNYGYHLNFLLHSRKKERGRELSWLGILNTLAIALGPLIAGVLIVVFNFVTLFTIGAFLLIIGAVSLFLGKENYEPVEINIKDTLRYFKNRYNWRNFLSFSGYAIEASINREIWPIYLIILMVSYDKMGLVMTLSFVISLLSFYLIGRATDKYDKRKLLKIMTGLYFLAWVGRLFANSLPKVLVVDSYKNLTERFLSIPWSASSYELAAQDKFYLFIVSREIMYNLVRIVIMPLIALIFYINFHPFLITIGIAAIFTLFYPALRKAR